MPKETDQLNDKEIERRMQDALKRAFNTPPKPFTPSAKGKAKKKLGGKRKPAK